MNSWDELFKSQEMLQIMNVITTSIEAEEKEDNCLVFPPFKQRFRIFESLSLDEIKVVIIGQDPYIRKGQAEGLSFSVPETCDIPPSLLNIFKALGIDGKTRTKKGNLSNWVDQGVMLLNMSLTVREGSSNSHAKLWKPFTDKLMKYMTDHCEHKVFLLWGNDARKWAPLFKKSNLVLEACHPSPMNGLRFVTEAKGHFDQANDYLVKHGQKPIEWK